MSKLEVFATIEELKADRVERKLTAEEIERQRIATESLAVLNPNNIPNSKNKQG